MLAVVEGIVPMLTVGVPTTVAFTSNPSGADTVSGCNGSGTIETSNGFILCYSALGLRTLLGLSDSSAKAASTSSGSVVADSSLIENEAAMG